MFYIDEDLDFNGLMFKCFDRMLCDKYNGYTFYVHNLDKYDSKFILPCLEGDLFRGVDFQCNVINRDEDILAIQISKKIKNKTYKIKLVDSIHILPFKLDDLGKTFDTDIKKTLFPYDFVS